MKTSTKAILLTVAFVVVAAGSFVGGWYAHEYRYPPGKGSLEPVGPPHTEPKSPNGAPMYNWKACGDHMTIDHTETVEDGKPYTTIECGDDCKTTTQKYRMKFTCPVRKHTIFGKLGIGGLSTPEDKKFDLLSGVGVGYLHHWELLGNDFGFGGEFMYSKGLAHNTRLYQGNVIFSYTF